MYFPSTLITNSKVDYKREEGEMEGGEADMVHGNKCVPCLLGNTSECFLMKYNPNSATQVLNPH